jgi:hypothetical protein
MLLTRSNLLCATICGVLALPHAGCMAPWAPSSAQVQAAGQATALVETANRATPGTLPDHDASAEPSLAGVLDKLQQVRAIDPAAEQKLMDELRQTPAESWPLVAEQFRASLAYHEQLAAKNRQSQQNAVEGDHAAPSEPVGTLVDPRAAGADEIAAKARAQSMHFAMQAPNDSPPAPAEFASDGPTYPIAATPPPSAGSPPAQDTAAGAVQPATFEVDGGIAPIRDTAGDDADWQQLIERAANDLSNRVAQSPATTAEVHQHVSLRMLRLLAGDTESALEPIPNISPAEQDYWSRQVFALATYLDHHSQPDDKRRAAASVTHLDEAVSHLRELGSLSLRNLAFCKNVYGYGAVEAYKSDRFAPGDEVSLYVEVENYHSQSTEKGYTTLLGSSYELLNDEGERVAGGEFPDVDDCCRTRRRDFHIQYGLTLPPTIEPGEYRLQLVVKDRQSDKIGRATAEFEIRGSRAFAPHAMEENKETGRQEDTDT